MFETSAISAGAIYYRWQGTTQQFLEGDHFFVLLGCILGAALGSKIVFWIEVPHLLALYWNQPEAWLGGQSMVGGLLGGLVGVESVKKLWGIRRSTGDAFVFPLLMGLMIGRMGCFLAGLADGTYGLPTDLPWGVDFGDGTLRHPTQLYEIIFAAVLWLFLHPLQPTLAPQPGLLFKILLNSYLLWRLLIDELKPLPFDYGFSFSGIQITCAVALLIYLPLSFAQWQKLKLNL
jgi:prolipoprotein diacylglyceryltransferase